MVDVGAVKISVPFIILQRILNSYGYKLGQLKSGFSNRFIYSTIIRMLGNEAGVGFLLSAYQARNQMAGENIVESMKQLREYLIELGIDPDQGIPPASPSAPNQSTPGTPGASSGLAASSQAQNAAPTPPATVYNLSTAEQWEAFLQGDQQKQDDRNEAFPLLTLPQTNGMSAIDIMIDLGVIPSQVFKEQIAGVFRFKERMAAERNVTVRVFAVSSSGPPQALMSLLDLDQNPFDYVAQGPLSEQLKAVASRKASKLPSVVVSDVAHREQFTNVSFIGIPNSDWLIPSLGNPDAKGLSNGQVGVLFHVLCQFFKPTKEEAGKAIDFSSLRYISAQPLSITVNEAVRGWMARAQVEQAA
jgi:hypothetical protein